MGGEGFIPWQPFEHPQLGRVEIGGWKTKFTYQNPPPKYLEAECEKLTRFALAHASCAPRLEAELKVEALSDGLRKVVLEVDNSGYLSTNVTRIAVDKKVARPVKAEIKLPEGAELVSGEREVDLGHLAGRSALAGKPREEPRLLRGYLRLARPSEWVDKVMSTWRSR